MAVGSTVKLNVNGVPTDFIIVHQGLPGSMYDESCNGTWLYAKDRYISMVWDSTNNDYANSDVHAYLNGTFLNLIDSNTQQKIKDVKIPYRRSYGTGTSVSSGSSGLSCKAFLLSHTELCLYVSNAPVIGAYLSYFMSCSLSGACDKRASTSNSASRSPYCSSSYGGSGSGAKGIVGTNANGSDAESYCTSAWDAHPALIMESDTVFNDDGTIYENHAPTNPPYINVPDSIVSGIPFNVSWGASTDPDGDAVRYDLQYKYPSISDWQNYLTATNNTTVTIQNSFDSSPLAFRVRAFDDNGAYSDWTVSKDITVVQNTVPSSPDGITVPSKVYEGKDIKITWGESTDTDGNFKEYQLQRSVNGDSYSTVYVGKEQQYIDTPPPRW